MALEKFEAAHARFEDGLYEDAASLYNQARQMDPKLLMGHVNYALALRQLPKTDGSHLADAAAALLEGIDLNPYHANIEQAFNHLGAIRREQGRFAEAAEAYKVRVGDAAQLG